MASGKQQQQQQQQQHVVAVPFPAQGHLIPVMRFCELLAKQEGVIVTFVDCDPIHHRLQEVHTSHAAVADDPAPPAASANIAGAVPAQSLVRRAHIPIHGLDLSNNFNTSFCSFWDSIPSIAPYLEQLILSLKPPVTCILSDFDTTFPTQDVADKLGIPRIMLYPCCASRLLLIHYLSQGEPISIQGVMEALSEPRRSGEVFCKGIPGLPTLYNKDLPHFRHVMDETLPLWEKQVETWRVCNTRARAVVVNSFESLEASTFSTLSEVCDAPIYDVGLWAEPLHKDSATSLWKEDYSCMTWLDQQPTSSVLYISFGSITRLSHDQFEELLSGLLSSQQRFLWVFRAGLVEGSSNDYPASIASFVSRSQGKGMVINWAPQLQVLAHASVGGFLTHCGWNSTCEAIAHGVPMLCWPYFADQLLNARLIVDEWKVGLEFERSKEDTSFFEKEEIEKVIRALMEGPEGKLVRQRVTSLKERSYECHLENGSSYIKFKALFNSL